MNDEKRMRLRYAGVCRVCEVELPARTEAIYERSSKTVRCLTHIEAEDVEIAAVPINLGTPGASARREFERRKAGRERRVRARYPKIGALLHAMSDEPQSTTAWNTGALGEERLGQRLNGLATDRLRVLHDRRIPGSRANIDHIAVAPSGVYVIDAKKYAGRRRLKIAGGFLRARTERLLVGTRDCTKVVDGVLKQVAVVKDVIADDVPVHGVLCFVDADWPLIGGSFTTREIAVLWPKKLYSHLRAAGPVTDDKLIELHHRLAVALPPA
jgi:hypothetical protein